MPTITEIRRFFDDAGHAVEAHYPHGQIFAAPTAFVGHMMFTQVIETPDGQRTVRPLPAQFPIPATTLEDAFKGFMAAAELYRLDLQTQAIRNEIGKTCLSSPAINSGPSPA